MVNLPPQERVRRNPGSGNRYRDFRNNVNDRRSLRVPMTIAQLEIQAFSILHVMEGNGKQPEHNFNKAMDDLCCKYNLNFMIICGRCRGVHGHYNRFISPER